MFASSLLPLGLLIAINLGLIWFLIGAPIGTRMVVVSRRIAASPERLWSALHPLGENALWDGSYISVEQKSADVAEIAIAFDGRDGLPIRRVVRFDDVETFRMFTMRTIDDTSLHGSFWANHNETVMLDNCRSGERD